MKKIFTFLFLSPLLAQGQAILVNKVDDFTGTWNVFTKMHEGKSVRASDYIDMNKEVLFSMAYTKPKSGRPLTYAIGLSLSGRDLGCLVQNSSSLTLLFEDDSTIELTQVGSTDCGSSYHFYSGIFVFASKSELEGAGNEYTVEENYRSVCKKLIKKIRVNASEGYRDYTLLPEKQSVMIKHSNLIDSITVNKE